MAVVVYAALGFGVLPWLLKSQWTQQARERLHRQGSIEAARFNPFTLRLELDGVRLAQADGGPLLDVGGMVADLQWASLLGRGWRLDELRIDRPELRLAISPDGRFNLAELLADKEPAAPAKSGGASPVPRVKVDQLSLTGGRVVFDDRQSGYSNVFAPIDLDLGAFSTWPDERDRHVFTAQAKTGGRLQWKGEASVEPMRASGEITLDDVSLESLGKYLKPFARVAVSGGRLAATLPYTVSYEGGHLKAGIAGARLAVEQLALKQDGASDSFAAFRKLQVEGVDADAVARTVTVGAVKLEAPSLAVRRLASGRIDLADLLVERPAAAETGKPAPWSVAVKQVEATGVALRATDESVQPPIAASIAQASLHAAIDAAQRDGVLGLQVRGGALQADGIALAQGTAPPLKVGRVAIDGASLDLAARKTAVDRVAISDGQLSVRRDAKGALVLPVALPAAAAPAAAPSKAEAGAGRAWSASLRKLELAKFAVDVDDQPTGLQLKLRDVGASLEGASSDLRKPVKIVAGLSLKEGGRLDLAGSAVPDTGAVQARVQAKQLALPVLQPLLARKLRLVLAAGTASSSGQLAFRPATRKDAPPAVKYEGSVAVDGLALNETDGTLFLGWKRVAADRMTLGLAEGVAVPELRVVEPNATLIIEEDRSFNAARLLVRQPATAGPPAAAASTAIARPAFAKGGTAGADAPFPVRIQRVRLQGARLQFEDKSLRPQFAARIHELSGVVTGLSSSGDTRTQVELDGRVDEFGLARVRGSLSAFRPREDTNLSVVFRNVDMVSASPYAMKFAGYRIAEGRMSLDVRYRVRDGKLEGDNNVVIDKLRLGERVDSPDALKLPLELALAILTDSDGRIDLGLPVSGDLNDPQFSYAGVIWKAIGNVLTKIVTAPFRALGSLFGGSGEKLEAIDFDPGSDRLLPPEREKLQQVAQVLGKRPQLRLSVPASYAQADDGAALRTLAVRTEVARKAGIRVDDGERPGPLDLSDRSIRKAVRELFTQRLGDAEFDKARQAAEAAPAADGKTAKQATPPLQRLGELARGEPQVADATAFYRGLLRRLEQAQPLPAGALDDLGKRRAQAVQAALQQAGVDAARVATGTPAAVTTRAGTKAVPLKLDLAVQR